MSTNSFETFNSSATPFDTPFPGASEAPAEDTTNPFAGGETPTDTTSGETPVEGEKKKRGRKKKEPGEEGGDESKREMAPRLNGEQKTFVVKNYAAMGSDKVAAELGVNVNQVRNTIAKFRKDMQKRVENATSEEEKVKYEKFIEVFLPKRVAGEPGTEKRKERKASNQTIIDDLLKDLMV